MTGEEIMPQQQHKIIEAKFPSSPVEKAFKKQAIDEHDKKQLEALQALDLNNQQMQHVNHKKKQLKQNAY